MLPQAYLRLISIIHLNSKFSSFHALKRTHESFFDSMLHPDKDIHHTLDAHQLPDKMPDQDYRAWNALIRGCMMNHRYSEALVAFHRMQCDLIRPDCLTLAAVIKSSAVLFFHGFGRSLHGFAIKHGYGVFAAVAKALMDMYGRFDAVCESHKLFAEMDRRDSVSWNILLSGYVRAELNVQVMNLFCMMHVQGNEDAKPTAITIAVVLPVCAKMRSLNSGQIVHAYAIRSGLESDTLVGNALLSMYAKCSNVRVEAQYLFNCIVCKDVISWNSIISGYSEQGFFAEAFRMFEKMISSGFTPNHATVATVLPICAVVENGYQHGKEIHCYVLRSRLEKDLSASNALLTYYSKIGDMSIAESIFTKMQPRDLVSWNTIIGGCAMNGRPLRALGLLRELLSKGTKPDPITLISALSACAQLHYVNEGKKIHAYVLQHPKLSWNLMLQVYAQHDLNDRAICLFREFQDKGMRPDTVSIMSILPACARLASVCLVRQCHGYKTRASFDELQLEGTLLDAYSKCGNVNDAQKLFHISSQKDLVTFTAMISCYAMHGMAGEALGIFFHMLELNIKPDHVIFTTLLSACSHAGLVDEGWKLFKSIDKTFGIRPTMEHYACMVDLLARGGRLREAYEFIKDMPCKPNASVWGSLLGACKMHCEVEVGQLAANNLFNAEGGNIGNYVVMSNIYAAGGKWDSVEQMRKMMKTKDLKKPAGCSWIEVDSKRHVFVAADLSHPNRSSIYDVLVTLDQQIKELHS